MTAQEFIEKVVRGAEQNPDAVAGDAAGQNLLDLVRKAQGEQVIRYPDNIADFVPGSTHNMFHKTEDAFEAPKINAQIEGASYYEASEQQDRDAFLNSPVFTPEVLAARMSSVDDEHMYEAEWGPKGEAVLVRLEIKTTKKFIAWFDTFADAQKAAEALNNHEGY